MTEHYASTFAALKRQYKGAIPTWLGDLREGSMAHFLKEGFPTPQQEAWRFTNLKSLHGENFRLATEDDTKRLSPDQFVSSCLAGAQAFRIAFINGRHSDAHSTQDNLPEGALFTNLREALKLHPKVLKDYLGTLWTQESNSLVALNTALHNDGSVLYLPENCVIEPPIHFLYISLRDGQPTMSFPRNLVIAEKGSQATIIETYVGFGEKGYFTNAVTEIVAKEGAQIDHYKFQNELTDATHVSNLLTVQSAKSQVRTHSIALGGGLVRNDIKMRLDGPNAHCTLNGLYVLTGQQHVDHHTTVDHATAHCSSQELYKGVLDETSHGVFNGQVLVRPDAQKSDAQQMNQNLLLSEDAIIDTTPRLEIYADDVKCSHGATVGALDEDAIFYLRSRGLNRSEARNLLTFAFAN